MGSSLMNAQLRCVVFCVILRQAQLEMVKPFIQRIRSHLELYIVVRGQIVMQVALMRQLSIIK